MRIDIEQDALVLHWEGLERLWAFRLASEVRVEKGQVRSARNELPPSTWKEIRAPGTMLPGVIKAGTYYNDRGKELWCATGSKRASPLTIELDGARFDRIVLTIDDHVNLAERINAWASA